MKKKTAEPRATRCSESRVHACTRARAQIMAPLHHENLIRLFGGVWNEGVDKLCIVLEYCSAGSLKTLLKKDGSGTWEGLRHNLALGSARGLEYLHCDLREPLIHRDVKPDNILVDKHSTAKLADFGESTNFDRGRAKEHEDDEGNGDALAMTLVGTRLYCKIGHLSARCARARLLRDARVSIILLWP